MIEGFRVLDADAHVVEPAHVFAEWAPPGIGAIDLPPDTPMVPCGDFELLTDQFEHGFDGPSYLRAMDAQSIDAVVLYPSMGLFVPFLPALSAEASAAACRSYNDWIAEYCATDPDRMAGVGIVPLVDVDVAVEEATRVKQLGLIGVMVRPNHLYGRNLGDAAYDPLWARCVQVGLTVSVHEGLGLYGPTIGSDRFTSFVPRHAMSHPMEQMAAMASFVIDGALERHPELRVAFLESGTGWLPYWLARLDDHVEWLCEGRPSATELFDAHCVISTEADDDCVGMVVNWMGPEYVMWASDFPHPDAVYPGAPKAFLDECEEQGLSDDDVRVILWDGPLAFYGLEKRFTQ